MNEVKVQVAENLDAHSVINAIRRLIKQLGYEDYIGIGGNLSDWDSKDIDVGTDDFLLFVCKLVKSQNITKVS